MKIMTLYIRSFFFFFIMKLKVAQNFIVYNPDLCHLYSLDYYNVPCAAFLFQFPPNNLCHNSIYAALLTDCHFLLPCPLALLSPFLPSSCFFPSFFFDEQRNSVLRPSFSAELEIAFLQISVATDSMTAATERTS